MKHLQIADPEAHYNVSRTRVIKFTQEMAHTGLKEHKLISAPDEDMLRNKVILQAQKWAEKWDALEKRQRINALKQANAEEAISQTKAAEEAIKQIDNLLMHTLSVDDTVNWDDLKRNDAFSEKKPGKPIKSEHEIVPPKPERSDTRFIPKFSFLEKIFSGLKKKRIAEFDWIYTSAVTAWGAKKAEIDAKNEQIEAEFQKAVSKWEKSTKDWEKRKEAFLKEQTDFNAKIDVMKSAYMEKNPDSIVAYCEMVLNNSQYPESFNKDFELEYNPENGLLIVEYQLPSLDAMPKIKEVKYVAAKNELNETYLPEAQLAKMFDEAMYKIALRTIHELLEADAVDAITIVSFNGWVRAVNKGTGREENNCIISLQVNKAEFLAIDLRNVDPKTCFKNLKGVASSKLSSLTPVKPILQIDKSDSRFVDGYNVIDSFDTSTNLAAMDWEDFEHLIRELFEKEFMSSGGEVKVTQASRDGGVDAVAFDPDPIRGGKIVIQAKRYTNTVGLSAVRDLYGTVMNEGATKGILVSTADYGPDAYDFAKGKPLTLLNGSNLLHLLEKHGTHAKIDLKEAKKIIAEREREA